MRIEIHSRRSLIRRAARPFPPRSSLISVCDPDDSHATLKYAPDRCLLLRFDDITPELAVERLELSPDLVDTERLADLLRKEHNTVLFDAEMARKTADFIRSALPQTSVFILQCEFGQSRSAALGAAILAFRGRDPDVIFSDERYGPNEHVYKMLLCALQEGTDE